MAGRTAGKARGGRHGNEVERAASILASVRALVEARGNAFAAAIFHRLLSRQHLLERRFRVDADIVEDHRRAANAAQAIEGTRWDLGNPETTGSPRCSSSVSH